MVKVTNIELQDINRLVGYRNAHWYIKDTWIGFSTRKIAKQALVRHTFMASWTMCCLKWFKCRISSQFCCSLLKQENHMNMNMNMNNMNMEKWVVFASHWKSRKLLLILSNIVLMNWSIINEGLRGFLSWSLSSKAVFGMCYIRVFCKILGWSLLWTTTVVHDSIINGLAANNLQNLYCW